VIFTISSKAQAFSVGVASIGYGSEINGYGTSAIGLIFAFLEEDSSALPSSSEESAFRILCRRASSFVPDIAMIAPLQITHQWRELLHWRPSFISLPFSCSDVGMSVKACFLLLCDRFGFSFFSYLEILENHVILCPMS
jgi:hypothetical protein